MLGFLGLCSHGISGWSRHPNPAIPGPEPSRRRLRTSPTAGHGITSGRCAGRQASSLSDLKPTINRRRSNRNRGAPNKTVGSEDPTSVRRCLQEPGGALMREPAENSSRQGFPDLFSDPRRQFRAHSERGQALEVPGHAHQRPFHRHLLPSTEQEPPEPEDLLDDPEDRFHGLLP